MIDKGLINYICQSLEKGKGVHRKLPMGGKVVFDKVLPYICVYRFAKSGEDKQLSGFLKTQAAYLIIREDLEVSELLECIAKSVTAKFKSFMIIEMWPADDPSNKIIKILSPEEKAPATTRSLKENLEDIKIDYPGIDVKVFDSKHRHPDDLPPLLSIDQCKELGSLIIGLEIPTIYKHTDKEHFALLYRKLRVRVAKALKQAAFEFIRVQTSSDFTHYLMLGKTRLTKLVRSADVRIAEVSERMNFLMRVTPVNDVAEWHTFKKNNFNKTPSFNYRLIPLDPEVEKRKLYSIELERMEDPTLAYLLRNKRKELELQLTMLEVRQTPSFRHLSQSLFGEIPNSTRNIAHEIMNNTQPEDVGRNDSMDCHEFAARANRELDFYRPKFGDLDLQVEIRQDLSGLMVSKSHLLVGDTLIINPARAEALIQHEVGTHILTYCNGKRQPLHQMYAGLDGYDQMQEGLAVLAEYLVGGLTAGRLRLLAARVIAVDMMVNNADFIETFRYLHEALSFSARKAFDITTRVFRGGGFTKDAVYLRGLQEVLQFLGKGGHLETLYIGKFDLKHVELIEELVHRNVLKKPQLPPFLNHDQVKERLILVENGLTPIQLLDTALVNK